MDNPVSSNNQTVVQTITNIDPLQKYKKLYFILGGLGAIILLITSFNPIAALIGALVGAGIAWFIIASIALGRTIKLNLIDYTLPANVTENQLLEYLKSNFSHSEIELDRNSSGIKFVFRNSSIHIIKLNEKKKNFSIFSTATKKARIKNGGKTNSAKLYRNIVQVTPIIKTTIEDAANIISGVN